jgi:hypothetical protein
VLKTVLYPQSDQLTCGSDIISFIAVPSLLVCRDVLLLPIQARYMHWHFYHVILFAPVYRLSLCPARQWHDVVRNLVKNVGSEPKWHMQAEAQAFWNKTWLDVHDAWPFQDTGARNKMHVIALAVVITRTQRAIEDRSKNRRRSSIVAGLMQSKDTTPDPTLPMRVRSRSLPGLT